MPAAPPRERAEPRGGWPHGAAPPWYPCRVKAIDRFCSLVAAGVLAACGSTEGEASAPSAGAPSAPDPAAACLAIANAEHPKRPDEPASITVSHVLVKHTGSKSPRPGVTRSRAEACLRAMEARDKLRAGESFESIVGEYSDEAGASTRAGSIGQIRREDVLAPFADVAFELDRAQLSDLVETEFGFHVVLRTE